MGMESVVRAMWARAMHATMHSPAPDAIGRARRVLFLRHDAVGDMLSSLGVIRALAEHGLAVEVLASPANAAVLPDGTWGVRVIVWPAGRAERRMMRSDFAANPYDVVVDGLVLNRSVNTRTIRLLRDSGAPVRVGTAGRTHSFVYTHPVDIAPGANHVEVLASLLPPFGIDAARALAPVAMPLHDAERQLAESWWRAGAAGRRLFVNLSASGAERRWSDAHFVRVLQVLRARHPDLQVVVTGAPPDWPAARAIAEAAGARAFSGGLREAFALLAASDAALTPDTSVGHAAAGFGVPSAVLMPGRNARFAPWRAATRVIVGGERDVHPITEDAVVEAVHDVLGERVR